MSNSFEMPPLRASRYMSSPQNPIAEAYMGLIGVGMKGGSFVGGIVGGTAAVCLPFLVLYKLSTLW